MRDDVDVLLVRLLVDDKQLLFYMVYGQRGETLAPSVLQRSEALLPFISSLTAALLFRGSSRTSVQGHAARHRPPSLPHHTPSPPLLPPLLPPYSCTTTTRRLVRLSQRACYKTTAAYASSPHPSSHASLPNHTPYFPHPPSPSLPAVALLLRGGSCA